MFGPVIRFPDKTRLELRGTPPWIPAVLLLIVAFSITLAWVFFSAGELWSESLMGRSLRHATDAGEYVASWPTALMTLALGLPWLLALTRVQLLAVTLDARAGQVSVRPIGPLPLAERHIPMQEVTALEVARVRPALPGRLMGRDSPGTRPVLRLASGEAVALVRKPVPREQSEKILHMARKVLAQGGLAGL